MKYNLHIGRAMLSRFGISMLTSESQPCENIKEIVSLHNYDEWDRINYLIFLFYYFR